MIDLYILYQSFNLELCKIFHDMLRFGGAEAFWLSRVNTLSPVILWTNLARQYCISCERKLAEVKQNVGRQILCGVLC